MIHGPDTSQRTLFKASLHVCNLLRVCSSSLSQCHSLGGYFELCWWSSDVRPDVVTNNSASIFRKQLTVESNIVHIYMQHVQTSIYSASLNQAPRNTFSPYLLHDTETHWVNYRSGIMMTSGRDGTYPTNCRAVIAGGRLMMVGVEGRGDKGESNRGVAGTPTLAFIALRVMNSHRAFSPGGVPSVVQVLSVIVPSEPPVASTPRCEYSRS